MNKRSAITVAGGVAGALVSGVAGYSVRVGSQTPAEAATATKPIVRTQIQTITRIITESPALLARERQVFDAYARDLGALLAEDTEADRVSCQVVANALLGLHRALIDSVREQALAGAPASRIRRNVRRDAERAIAQLAGGLGDFGVR